MNAMYSYRTWASNLILSLRNIPDSLFLMSRTSLLFLSTLGSGLCSWQHICHPHFRSYHRLESVVTKCCEGPVTWIQSFSSLKRSTGYLLQNVGYYCLYVQSSSSPSVSLHVLFNFVMLNSLLLFKSVVWYRPPFRPLSSFCLSLSVHGLSPFHIMESVSYLQVKNCLIVFKSLRTIAFIASPPLVDIQICSNILPWLPKFYQVSLAFG